MADPTAFSRDLFAAILANDEMDTDARLPAAIMLDYQQDQLAFAFRVALAVWCEGYERDDLVRIASHLRTHETLDASGQLVFKHIRARFKHLRFAFAMFGEKHRYPVMLDIVTSVQGNVQDAFKNGVKPLVRREAWLLWLVCQRPLYRLMLGEVRRFRPSTMAGFKSFVRGESAKIVAALEKAELTAHEFHNVRKIISRNRAAFATLSVVQPSENNVQTARFIATINGLMGNYHDVLMARKLDGTLDYERDKEPLKPEVRERLEALSARLAEGAKA